MVGVPAPSLLSRGPSWRKGLGSTTKVSNYSELGDSDVREKCVGGTRQQQRREEAYRDSGVKVAGASQLIFFACTPPKRSK